MKVFLIKCSSLFYKQSFPALAHKLPIERNYFKKQEDHVMKNLFLIVSLSALMLVSVKNSGASEFSLRLFDNSTFTLVFDEEIFNSITGSISFQNVSPGKHYLRVEKIRISPHGTIIGLPRIIYEGMIHIRSGREIYAMIDNFGRYIIEEEYSLHDNYPPVAPPVYIPPYMNDNDFSMLKNTIDRLSFESSKSELARQAAASNILTSFQVYEIMELFTFESTKVDFAKFAFHKVYDKNNYYLVNNAFTFSSSISELDRYMNGMR